MKKNKWVLLLIAFVAFLVLVYFIGACLNATAEALTIISLCIGILVIYLVVKAVKSKIRKGKCDHEYKKIHQKTYGESALSSLSERQPPAPLVE